MAALTLDLGPWTLAPCPFRYTATNHEFIGVSSDFVRYKSATCDVKLQHSLLI